MKENEFYTQNGFKGSSYDSNLSTKEIAARIREYVKTEFPDCKFSVRKETYSGGASIYIILFESSRDVLNREVPQREYIQLNPHYIKEDELLSDYGKELFCKLDNFVSSYRFSDCDGMIDYFRTNFYQHIYIGDFEKPYKVVEKDIKSKPITSPNSDLKLINYSPKSFAIIGDTKPHKDVLKELGGSFNPRLTCGAGWIFPLTKKEAVISAFGI